MCQAAPDSSQLSSGTTAMSGIGKLQTAEFDAIPKYMKGRLTLEKVNMMVDLLNQLYADKYAVMLQNPNRLPHEVRQKYWVSDCACKSHFDR